MGRSGLNAAEGLAGQRFAWAFRTLIRCSEAAHSASRRAKSESLKKNDEPLHKVLKEGHTFPPPSQGSSRGHQRQEVEVQQPLKKVLTETKSLT